MLIDPKDYRLGANEQFIIRDALECYMTKKRIAIRKAKNQSTRDEHENDLARAEDLLAEFV